MTDKTNTTEVDRILREQIRACEEGRAATVLGSALTNRLLAEILIELRKINNP